MTRLFKLATYGAVVALIGAGALAATTTAASAYTACNRYGDCWQTSQRYHYPVRLQVWYPNESDYYWRRHHHSYRRHLEQNRDNGYWDRDRTWHNY